MTEISRELEALVLGLPAVTALYGNRSTVASVVDRVGGAVRVGSRLAAAVQRVGVQVAADMTTVTLSVGIDGSASAVATADQITAAIAAHIAFLMCEGAWTRCGFSGRRWAARQTRR